MSSGLDPLHKRKLENAAISLGFEIASNWTSSVTHLVVKLSADTMKKEMLTTRSMKYLMALMSK